MKIGMFTVSDSDGMGHARFARERSLELASGNHLVQWNLISLNGTPGKMNGFWLRGQCYLPMYNHPSYYHAMALNMIPLYQEDYDVIVICDADFVLMMKDWDLVLEEVMEDNHILGTLDECWSVVIRPFFVAFRRGVLTTGLDFRPIELNPGGEAKKGRGGRDTGCRIVEYALKNNLRYKYIEAERISPEFRAYTSVYKYGDRLFGSHMGNMRNDNFEDKYAQSWKDWVIENTE